MPRTAGLALILIAPLLLAICACMDEEWEPEHLVIWLWTNPGINPHSAPGMLAAFTPAPRVLGAGDLNADGMDDLVLLESGTTLRIYLGPTLRQPYLTYTLNPPTAPNSGFTTRIADIDGDGMLDLYVSYVADLYYKQILFNRGSYFEPVPSQSGYFAKFTSALKMDMYTPSGKIYIGDGVGNFTYATDIGNDVVAHGDLTGDGNDDLVAKGSTALEYLIYVCDGAGGFLAPQPFNLPEATYQPVFSIAELNSDGNCDLIIGDLRTLYTDRFIIFIGDGLGGFTSLKTVDVGSSVSDIAMLLGDYDLDGDIDVISPLGEYVLINDGAANLTQATPFPSASYLILDSTGEGAPDLLRIDYSPPRTRTTTTWKPSEL